MNKAMTGLVKAERLCVFEIVPIMPGEKIIVKEGCVHNFKKA